MFLLKQRLVIILFLAAIIGGGSGLLVFKYLESESDIPEVEVPVFIDFEEGAEGDFLLEMERKDETVLLSWPEEIKVVQVRVYDLGDPRYFEDHKMVFFTANFKMDQDRVESIIPPSLERFSLAERSSSAEEMPEPDTYLAFPYQVGSIPQGFYENTPEKTNPIFTEDHRYLIEVGGIKQGKGLVAEYVLIFKEQNE